MKFLIFVLLSINLYSGNIRVCGKYYEKSAEYIKKAENISEINIQNLYIEYSKAYSFIFKNCMTYYDYRVGENFKNKIKDIFK